MTVERLRIGIAAILFGFTFLTASPVHASACTTDFDCSNSAAPVCMNSVCSAGPSECTGDDVADAGNTDDGPVNARSVQPAGPGTSASLTGAICGTPSSEADWYKVNAASGAGLTVSVSWVGNADLDLAVYDSSGQSQGYSLHESPETVSLTYLPDGTYYLRVRNSMSPASVEAAAYQIDVGLSDNQSCSINADCAANFSTQLFRSMCITGVCQAQQASGLPLTSPCDSDNDCASGLCSYVPFESGADRSICTAACSSDADCSAVGGVGGGTHCTKGFAQNRCEPSCSGDQQCGADTTIDAVTPGQPWLYYTCTAAGACLDDRIFADTFGDHEHFTLTINDYLGKCSISVDSGAPTSSPLPMSFPGGKVVALNGTANPMNVWRYWTGTDGADPYANPDTTVTMTGDRQVLACCETAEQNTCRPTLTVAKSGIGSGLVTSDIPGIDCGADCDEMYPLNQHVVLTASPAAGSKFAGWTGGGCSGTGTCSVTISSVVAITAAFDPVVPNKVFVTSLTSTGSLGGLAGADALCQARASAAALPGTFVAWLSTIAGVNAKDRLAGARGWVRTDGKPVADQVSDIVSGHLFYPIALAENGVSLGSVAVTTATNPSGTFASQASDCSNWTSTSGSTVIGNASSDGGGFTTRGSVSCATPSHLYCFGVDNAVAVTAPPVTARRAFLSVGWGTRTGILSADQQCATEATAANLPGSFKALLATSTASAIARFDQGGTPWARPDNILLTPTAAGLATAQYLDAAPMSNAANSVWYANVPVWSGASTLNAVGTAASTCNDWTSSSGSAMYGLSDATNVADWRNYSTSSCNMANAIVCLQQ